ncbi:MAG: DUF2227 family putative metal-binding protein [Anaerolineae bacterium]|nr:DUF2227 family putative metal-binding protein [Anaerolineae bacterium]
MTGEQHAKLHAAVGIGLSCGAIALISQCAPCADETMLALLGYALGAVVTPDWDLPRTRAHALMRRVPIVGWALVAYARLYARIFAHRGISHLPIIGTLTRAAWLLAPLVAFGLRPPTHAVMLVVAGLSAADVVHLIGDAIGTRRKYNRRSDE